MNFKSTAKKGSLIAALSLGLSVTAIAPVNPAFAADNTTQASQKLVDSLKALNLDHVDYLYAYLQSIDLSDSEYKGILDNTNRASQILSGQKNLENLAQAQKVEVLRLFVDSVKLAHLQAAIVDEKGNAIDLTTYKAGASTLVIQLKDLKGNVLGTLDPKKEDLDPQAFKAKVNALRTAIQAKEQLEKSGKFVPMPAGTLPNTATNDVNFMLLGSLLIALGGLAIIPAARFMRKSGQQAEA